MIHTQSLDLDLLRKFVAITDLNAFSVTASFIDRNLQLASKYGDLNSLWGKNFASHSRNNKLLTEHRIQMLSYACKILLYNNEVCTSLMSNNIQGVLTIALNDRYTFTYPSGNPTDYRLTLSEVSSYRSGVVLYL